MCKRLWTVSCVLAVALAGGCGKEPPPPILPTGGTILLDGKPVNNAEVVFIPVIDCGTDYIAKGVTDEQGRFKVACKAGPGACAGENHVLVKEGEIPPKLRPENAQNELKSYRDAMNWHIPQRYKSMADNPLRVTVTADSKDQHVLFLKKAE